MSKWLRELVDEKKLQQWSDIEKFGCHSLVSAAFVTFQVNFQLAEVEA